MSASQSSSSSVLEGKLEKDCSWLVSFKSGAGKCERKLAVVEGEGGWGEGGLVRRAHGALYAGKG